MQHQRPSRPRTTKHRFLCSNISRELGFERFAFLGENVPTGIHRPNSGFADFVVHEHAGERDFLHFAHVRLTWRCRSTFRCAPIPKQPRRFAPLPRRQCRQPTATFAFQSNPKTRPTLRATVLPAETRVAELPLPPL